MKKEKDNSPVIDYDELLQQLDPYDLMMV